MAIIHEREKEINLNDETYILRKYDARTGVFMLKIVAQKVLPLWEPFQKLVAANEAAAKEKEKQATREKQATSDQQDTIDQNFFAMLTDALASVSPDEINTIMDICLRHTDKLLRSGATPIMDGKRFAIAELEYDPMACLQLCVQSIMFNFQDFFGEKGLGSFLGLGSSSQPTP